MPDLKKQLGDKSDKGDGVGQFFSDSKGQPERAPAVVAEVKPSPPPPQVAAVAVVAAPATKTTVFMFTDDRGLVSATLADSKVLHAVPLCADAFPADYSVGVEKKLYWSPRRLKFIPEIGILSFLQSPTKIILFDVFQKYQDKLKNLSVSIVTKDMSASKAELKIETTEVSSDSLGLSFELKYAFEDSWADCLDATALCKNSDPPSIGLITTSGSMYRFQIQKNLEVGEPDTIYSELRPSNCSSVQRSLAIDGNIFCIGNFCI